MVFNLNMVDLWGIKKTGRKCATDLGPFLQNATRVAFFARLFSICVFRLMRWLCQVHEPNRCWHWTSAIATGDADDDENDGDDDDGDASEDDDENDDDSADDDDDDDGGMKMRMMVR